MPLVPVGSSGGLAPLGDLASETPVSKAPAEAAPSDSLELTSLKRRDHLVENEGVYLEWRYPLPDGDDKLIAAFRKDPVLAAAFKNDLATLEKGAGLMKTFARIGLQEVYADLWYADDADKLIKAYPELPADYLKRKVAGNVFPPAWKAFWKADLAWAAKGGFTPSPLSDAAKQLPTTPGFKQLFPNFDVLSPEAREYALRTISRFTQAFPDFIHTLNRVKDPRNGPGFQLYFVPKEPQKGGPLKFIQEDGDVKPEGKHAGIVYSHNQAFFTIRMAGPLINAVHAPQIGGVAQSNAEELPTDKYFDVLAHELGHLLHDHYLNHHQQGQHKDLYVQALKAYAPFGKDEPYWATNEREFFAEAVMAHLTDFDRPTPPWMTGKQRFYTREQLQTFHPDMAAFVAKLFSGKHQKPWRVDGGQVSLRMSQVAGQTVGGAGLAVEKDLAKADFGRLSLVGTGEAMGNQNGLVLRGSTGLRATLGRDPNDGLPTGVYAEGGIAGTATSVTDKPSLGWGPYAAAGVTVKGAQVEARRDWSTLGTGNTVSLGYAVRF